MTKAYYYVMYAVRRFTRAGPRNQFGEFQAHLALVIAEGAAIVSAIPARYNSVGVAIAVAVALALLNGWIFSPKNQSWRTRCEEFARMQRSHRVAADTGVAFFFIVAMLVVPTMARWINTGSW
jgi:hypothetical protein